MRLWSIHPKYLDTKGLVALWREALLARKVLEGNTNGYRHHPQLWRFREHESPLDAINRYLTDVYCEASARKFRFDPSKLRVYNEVPPIEVSRGQMNYEHHHLLNKLEHRAPERYREFCHHTDFTLHPMFRLTEGPVAHWERFSENHL